jgi:DNA-binding GntR family transcriptional regulator
MQMIQRLSRETAREYVYRTIRANIVSLDLAPGTMVSETELSVELGVSRTPVREALIELSKSNLVEIYPQRGSFIALIDSELVDEARFLRLVLEKAMVELVCDIATQDMLLPLEQNLKLQEFYLEQASSEQILLLDDEFHKLLFLICKKEYSYKMLETMIVHFDRVRSLSISAIRDIKIVSDHKELLEAIRRKDKEMAKSIITKHLTRYKIDEEALRKEYSHYFKQ